ncbi:beta-propeller domain-containing protein [Patescibacteria group bacterium]|nr:beta-propeller domain-containing protein [Patescibacteria group bacterium]
MSKGGKAIIIILIVIIILFLGLGGLAIYGVYKYIQEKPDQPDVVLDEWPVADSLQTFSDKEFDEYTEVMKEQTEEDGGGFFNDLGLGDVGEEALPESADMVAEAPKEAAEGESITNVQEIGVDEGDIVKSFGDYLVVLRRGRLFVVQVKDGDEQLLRPVYKGDAYAKGSNLGTWYDEMLIYDNYIVVIGYSYEMSATEIGVFQISDQGQISHVNTFFMDSNDYYSSRNYASRLVDGQLIFYMPYYLFSYDYDSDDMEYKASLPEIRQWKKGSEVSEGKAILEKTDIYQPVQETSTPTLHTVVSCDLESKDFYCDAKAVTGPYARSFYVSPEAVYIWVSDYNYYNNDDQNEPNAYVYRMPLDLSDAGVVRAYGAPIDQFSFKEGDDGYLNVLVSEIGLGDAMWNPEYKNSNLALARFSLEDFSDTPVTLDPEQDFRSLPAPEGYTWQNRFVGDYLLYGAGSSWYDAPAETKVYLVDYKNDNPVKEIDLENGVDRIDLFDGNNAVVIGGREDDLLFNWIRLPEDGSDPQLLDTYTLPNASEGETRSHGFFYSASEQILGLPVRTGTSEGYEQLWTGSCGVNYLKVNWDTNKFEDLGVLSSTAKEEGYTDADDGCLYSCTDWYGNARPIFYMDRIFALMGYELSEGEVKDNKMEEIRRTDFYVLAP